MCGIVGMVYQDAGRGVDPEAIRTMCDAIAHRGPDDQGQFEFTDVPYGVYQVRAAGPVQNYTRRAFNRIAVAEPVVKAELELR